MNRRILFLGFLVLFLTFYRVANAQDIGNLSVAIPLIVEDEKIQEGDIISKTGKEFSLAKELYDANIYGVIVDQSPLELYSLDGKDDTYAVSSGQAAVRVSTKNGSIKINDLITSSDLPGVGVKAVKSGYVLGRAIESHDSEEIGLINVQLQPHYEGDTAISKKYSWWQILLILYAVLHL